PTGGDVGVESLGSVPAGFGAGGDAYLADRATSNNPHPGTDSLLRLDSGPLLRAGVREAALLVATERGALAVGLRCGRSCTTFEVARGPAVAHGEGHLLVVADHPARASGTLPAASDLGAASRRADLLRLLVEVGAITVLALVGAGLIAWWLRRRRE